MVGHIGMPFSEFWKLSWGEFSYQVEGYYQRERDKWRRTREIITMQYNSHAKHPKSAQQLMPLDGKVSESKVNRSKENYWKWRRSLTPEEYREWEAKMKQAINNKN